MILFLGAAGSGKSLQGQLLADRHGWKWLSAGQLLRDSDNPEIQSYLIKGKLAPLHLTFETISVAIDKVADKNKIVLDGFPRSLEQADWLVEGRYKSILSLVIVLEVSIQEVTKRIELRGRSDDTKQALYERLELYHKEIDPIVSLLKSKNIRLVTIDGEGSIEEVYDRIQKELKTCDLI